MRRRQKEAKRKVEEEGARAVVTRGVDVCVRGNQDRRNQPIPRLRQLRYLQKSWHVSDRPAFRNNAALPIRRGMLGSTWPRNKGSASPILPLLNLSVLISHRGPTCLTMCRWSSYNSLYGAVDRRHRRAYHPTLQHLFQTLICRQRVVPRHLRPLAYRPLLLNLHSNHPSVLLSPLPLGTQPVQLPCDLDSTNLRPARLGCSRRLGRPDHN